MGGVVSFGKVLKVEPRVDLRGGDAGMPQKLLHRPQITAGLQQMAGKGMPQHVGMHRCRHTGQLTAPLESLPHRLRCQACGVLTGKQGQGLG